MHRIKPNRCGYVSGYICKPISSLNPLFQHTYTNAYATESIATGSGATYDFESAWIGPTDSGVLLQGTIDNYAQLPQQFEGFVMTLAPILNMSGNRTAPEVPELECRVDFDPFNSGEEAFLNPETGYMGNPATSETGFVDFYNQVDPEYKENVYVSVDGSTDHQQLYHTMPVYIEGSTTTPVSGIGYVITGGTNNTFTALTAGPGILEPMLDTELPPIGVDTIPSADIIGDFAMWEFNTINQWQKLVDARLNGLKTVIPTVDYGGIKGLYNLKNAEYQSGGCENFQIAELDVSIPVIGPSGLLSPTYTISGGTIYLNSNYVEIQGTTTGLSVFAAYLDVSPSGHTASVRVYPFAEVPMGIREAGHTYIYIGQVRRIDGLADAPLEGGTAFTLYKIEQGDCIDEVRTDYSTTDDYEGPFVLSVGYTDNVPYFYVGGFDGTSQDPHAGKVYLNGAFLDWGPVDAVGDGSSEFVYAHVTLTESSSTAAVSGYTMSDCKYDRSESIIPPAGTTSLIYTIRLGRVLDIDAVDQIHFGDIYLYTGDGSGASQIDVRYTGPFHVIPGTATAGSPDGLAVEGMHNEEGSNKAGNVVINGATAYLQPEGDVENVTLPCNIYANITLTKNNANDYVVTSCGYSCVEKVSTTTTTMYNVRLARAYISGSTVHVEQTHFGDIYIDLSPTTISTAGNYNGPFTVEIKDGSWSIKCDVCGKDDNNKDIYGWYSINGTADVPVTAATSYGGAIGTAKYVYFHKTATALSINTSSASTTDPTEYTVRLARIDGVTAGQLHYGNIQIDGRWM